MIDDKVVSVMNSSNKCINIYTYSCIKWIEHINVPYSPWRRGWLKWCGLEVSEFKFQSHYNIHFRINTLAKGQKRFIPRGMSWIVSVLFFYEDGFGMKYPTKVTVQYVIYYASGIPPKISKDKDIFVLYIYIYIYIYSFFKESTKDRLF